MDLKNKWIYRKDVEKTEFNLFTSVRPNGTNVNDLAVTFKNVKVSFLRFGHFV